MGGGVGGDNIRCTCTLGSCYATHGVGGGVGGDNIRCTCTLGWCYATHGVGGWGGDNIRCTCTLGSCYATHGVGGWGVITSVALAHLVDATQHMGWWVGWGVITSVAFANVSHNKLQFTKWHSKTRLTGTQALDKVWSHLKRHVPKSLWSRSQTDRRFNPRMEQYVYSYMCRFNNRNWWKQLGHLCKQQQKGQTRARMKFFFFFGVGRSSQCKIAKIKFRNQFWRVFYTSVKTENRKNRNYQWFWYGPCCPTCKLPGVLNHAGTIFLDPPNESFHVFQWEKTTTEGMVLLASVDIPAKVLSLDVDGLTHGSLESWGLGCLSHKSHQVTMCGVFFLFRVERKRNLALLS